MCTALEGGDYSVAMGLEVVPGALLPTLSRPWIKEVLEVGTQKRPEIAMVAPDRALLCATKGPNRPADDIECALFDTANGTTVWKAVVAKGDRDKKIYYNQPSLTKHLREQVRSPGGRVERDGQGHQHQGDEPVPHHAARA